MRPPERWPLHPAPVQGEALSSWLQRIASRYRMRSVDLLDQELGQPEVHLAELDLDPPLSLIRELAKRTGIPEQQLKSMTIAGYVPWLLDHLTPSPHAYEVYAHQLSVLLPPNQRKIYGPSKWLPWIPKNQVRRGCPDCLKEKPALLLFWQLPILLSCPLHGRMLETYQGHSADEFLWTEPADTQQTAPEALSKMDLRTWQAMTTGFVDLPRRSVHAGIWFRFLRTLIDELSATHDQYGRHIEDVRRIWKRTGHPFRAGQRVWRPFENLHWGTQQQLLEAAAIAMDMIEVGSLTALGTSAHLLLPEPESTIDDGTPPPVLKEITKARHEPLPDALWNQVFDSLNVTVEAATDDPTIAQSLFGLALHGCRSAESVHRLQETFTEMGLPLEPMSHNEDF